MTRRGAILHHLADLAARQAEALRELAALEGGAPAPPPSRPRKRAPRTLVPSPAPVDPEARQQARRLLARRGLHLAAVPKE